MLTLHLLMLLAFESARVACSLPWGNITVIGRVAALNPYTALILTTDNCYVEVLLPSTFYNVYCKPTNLTLTLGEEVIVNGIKYPSSSGNVLIPYVINVGGSVYYASPDICYTSLNTTTCTRIG